MKMTINELRKLIKGVIREQEDDKEQKIEQLKAEIKVLAKELANAPENEKQVYRDALSTIAQELKILREPVMDTTPNYEVEYLYKHEEGASTDSFEIYVRNPSDVRSEVNQKLKNMDRGFGITLISIYDLKNDRYLYKNDRTGGGYSNRDRYY